MTDIDQESGPDYTVEDAVRDGLARVEPAGDPAEEPTVRMTEHGKAASNDLMRESDKAVAMVASLYVSHCARQGGDDDELVHALAEITKFIARDANVNTYRIIYQKPELFDWLRDNAVSEEMVDIVEQVWIETDADSGGEAT